MKPLRVLDANPGWGGGAGWRGVYWTRERVLDALRSYVAETAATGGQLPSGCAQWNRAKRGRLDLPTAATVLRECGSLAEAWLAAGAPRARLAVGNRPWSERELEYLLEHAGDLTLAVIARHLHRTKAACRRRLYELGTRARDAQGYMSASQVAEHYGCTLDRVLLLIKQGVLRARRPVSGQRLWRISPDDAAAVAEQLRYDEAPPPDDGFERYLTPKEVAARVGLGYASIMMYLARGELRSVRRGRRYYVPESALRGFVPRSERPLGLTAREIAALPVIVRGPVSVVREAAS